MTPPRDDATQRISKRLTEGLDGVSERIDAGFASVRGAVDDLADHVRKVEARTRAALEEQDAHLTREFGQIEIGLGELRDRVRSLEDASAEQASLQVASVAEGAARGAGEAAGSVAAATAKIVSKGFLSTWMGKFVVATGGFTALVTGAGALPSVLRWLEKAWVFIRGDGP